MHQEKKERKNRKVSFIAFILINNFINITKDNSLLCVYTVYIYILQIQNVSPTFFLIRPVQELSELGRDREELIFIQDKVHTCCAAEHYCSNTCSESSCEDYNRY